MGVGGCPELVVVKGELEAEIAPLPLEKGLETGLYGIPSAEAADDPFG